jgi:hypothetical protein
MDSTVNLLKEEINKTMEAEHDLAKWKLGVSPHNVAVLQFVRTASLEPFSIN